MALRLSEFFGYPVGYERGVDLARRSHCPFVGAPCIKPEHGACSLEALKDPLPVICCPNRLYADNFALLTHVANTAFQGDFEVLTPNVARDRKANGGLTGNEVVAFGRYLGQELPLPKASALPGAFYMDWVLVRIDPDGEVSELTALEVQTIDTTGSYKEQSLLARDGLSFTDKQGRSQGYSSSGFNWENVNKRILPQVIYKGHALRRERLCHRGFFFACPQQVLNRIMERLGGQGGLHEYPMQAGTVTFVGYDLTTSLDEHGRKRLSAPSLFTTTIDQVALAFTSPRNLPEAGVYERAANGALR